MTKPTHTRYWVVVFAATLAMIQYVDRVCISQAAPTISDELQLSPQQKGYVFGAFTLAYALFEIPGGWLADRFGPRKILLRIVCWWSFFTAATGWVLGATSLIAVRFFFGAGEAGCFPNIARAFMNWLLPHERARAQSILWLAARWGGAITPLLVVAVLDNVSWRTAFSMFGVLGLVWAAIFYWWFRDDPTQHASVNEGERSLLASNRSFVSGHGNVPWELIFSSVHTLLIWGQYFCLSYVWYFYVTWLPTYLKDTYGKSHGKYTLALLAGVPLLAGGVGSIFSGFLVYRLTNMTGSVRTARRILGAAGFGLAAITWLICPQLKTPLGIMTALGLTSFFGDLSLPCSWASCMDMAGRFAGTYSGSMNMMGNLGGVAAPVVTGYILAHNNNDWTPIFYLSGAAAALGAVCWALVDPVTPLEQKATSEQSITSHEISGETLDGAGSV